MTAKNPLEMAKDLATHALLAGVGAAGSAAGIVKGAVAAGRSVLGDPPKQSAASDDAGTVETPEEATTLPAAGHEPVDEPPVIDPDEPVNVVEELGLDPAPADRPEGQRATTTIDAAVDPEHVQATPADIADNVAGGPSTGR